MRNQRHGYTPGDLVVVKSAAAIMATLDEHGCRDGIPFMPEMLTYCGACLPVWRRIESVCEESTAMRRLRRMVFLGDLRCDGEGHDGCEKGCRFFWHEDWLELLGHHTPVAPGFTLAWPYPVRDGERYFCQSTALRQASRPAGRLNPCVMLLDVLHRTWSPRQLIRFLAIAMLLKAKRIIDKKPSIYGDRTQTESPSLNVQAGEWVRVKSREEITQTLDRNGRNRGLEYPIYMLPFFEQCFRVRAPVRRIVREDTGRMQEIRNTVTLDGATCDGHGRCGGCPRGQFHFWRECWLERTSPPPHVKPVRAPARYAARILSDDDWDTLIDRHPGGTIYHTSGWRQAVEATFPQARGFQCALDDAGGLPVYLTRNRLPGRRLMSPPFATDCRPLVDNPAGLAAFAKALMRHFKADTFAWRAVGEVPVSWLEAGATPRIAWKSHRLDLTAGPDALYRKLSRTNVRQRIRRARESGLQVVYSADVDAICEFYILFAVTRKRLGLPLLPALFFRNLARRLPQGTLRVSLALQDKRPVAGLFALRYKDMMHYEYAGYHPEAAANGANQLLWWDGIERACAEGVRAVSLGCTAPANEGLLAYKRHWGGEEQDLLTAVIAREGSSPKPASATGWKDHAVVRQLFQRAPEPAYRGLSRLVYRHWC